ncbi:MAG: PDZ domain-containing protein [Planctomycetota bacterium]|jgi:S1-C subfamily serine protease
MAMHTKMKVALLTAVLALLLTSPPSMAAKEDLGPLLRAALVKVHMTSQNWDSGSPWNKNRPHNYTARGVVIRPGLVLMPSSGVPDNLMIEVSEANSARRFPASLMHVDYGAGLALVKIDDEDLLKRVKPLPIGDPITLDAEFEVWQLGSSELLERYTGRTLKVYPSGPKLNLTIKTNLADGGNGQVALKDGRIVGLVTYTRSSRQEGRLTAVETIEHFIKDYESGEYRGFGAGGLWWHDLLRDDLRTQYMVPEDAHGLLVSHVVPGHTGHGAVMPGDVITHLAGHDLDDEGMFVHPLHGRIGVDYLLRGATHPGDKVPAKILRKGKPMDVEIPIHDWPLAEQLVPSNTYDRRPPFMVVGGLVILELTQSVGVGDARLRKYQERAWWDPPGERKRIIYASRVLDDPANKGLEDIYSAGIKEVNGKKITRMRDVADALLTPLGEYHVFTFEGLDKPFVIKAAELEKINARIAERYKIKEQSYIETD